MLNSEKLYAIKFDGHVDVYLVYPLGAVRPVSPKEWAALTEAGVPLVPCGADEWHWKAVDQQAWASRGYVNRPGE